MKAEWRQLIDKLIANGVLQTPAVIEAFETINREDFVPDALRSQAYVNEPLPIGFGQTISQPWTVAFMLEKLQPAEGQKILDIGFGSGWQTALLAQVVGDRGRVIGLELIPELTRQGVKNIVRYNFISRRTVELHCLNGVKGFPAATPFDRIISAASTPEIPSAWFDQLKIGGRLIAPVDSTIILVHKIAPDKFDRETFPGFAFVPFISE
ncbi:MAG: protein-L-isoaspartate O-methyltransferase [Candidatus Vogelbacteria bacterium]